MASSGFSGGKLRRADAARDALRLAEDVLALAQAAMAASEVIEADEIRWPVAQSLSILRGTAAPLTADRAALREVMGGLSEVVAQLDARAVGDFT